jgi:hypothetical protein
MKHKEKHMSGKSIGTVRAQLAVTHSCINKTIEGWDLDEKLADAALLGAAFAGVVVVSGLGAAGLSVINGEGIVARKEILFAAATAFEGLNCLNAFDRATRYPYEPLPEKRMQEFKSAAAGLCLSAAQVAIAGMLIGQSYLDGEYQGFAVGGETLAALGKVRLVTNAARLCHSLSPFRKTGPEGFEYAGPGK